MDEQQARQRIRSAYSRLSRSSASIYETDVESDDQTIMYHINAIRTASGGQWNNTIASDYVKNLESQLDEEIVANDRRDNEDEAEDEIDQRYDRSM